jgi:Uri superfamily endonuclease
LIRYRCREVEEVPAILMFRRIRQRLFTTSADSSRKRRWHIDYVRSVLTNLVRLTARSNSRRPVS